MVNMYNKWVKSEHNSAHSITIFLISTDGSFDIFRSWKHMSCASYEIHFHKTMMTLAAFNLCLCSRHCRGFFRYIDR